MSECVGCFRRMCRDPFMEILQETEITTLFLDIGGVLLTDGWDYHARKWAATHFKLELVEMGNRHHLTFDT